MFLAQKMYRPSVYLIYLLYRPSVYFKDGLMLYVFESLKWKSKIKFENPNKKCLKFGITLGK